MTRLGNIDGLIDEIATMKPGGGDSQPGVGSKDSSPSGLFHREVCRRHKWGWSADKIEDDMRRNPAKYAHTSRDRYESEGRLRAEIARRIGKAREGGRPSLERASSVQASPSNEEKSIALPFRWICDSRATKIEWLVKGLILKKGIGLLVGKYAAGKTYVAIDLSLGVSIGAPFAGRKSKKSGVLYFAAERPAQLQRRAQFIAFHRRLLDPSVLWCATCPLLTGTDTLNILIATVREVDAAIFARRGIHIGLVIIDTLMVAAGWSDESNSAEVQSVIKVMRALSEATNTFVLAVDHTGKDVSRGARGSSDKESSSDIVLTVSERCCLIVTKCTDGESGIKIPFELVEHDLGTDEDGDKKTECTVKWEGVVAARPTSDEDAVLDVLLEFGPASVAEIAKILKWFTTKGDPYKSRALRAVNKLIQLGLAEKTARGFLLTAEGIRSAKNADPVGGSHEAEN